MRDVKTGQSLISRIETQLATEFHDLIGIEPPPVLHHYTTAAGLLGILESRQLWLSDARFLNDQMELTYGRHLVVDLLRASASSIEWKWLRQLFTFAVDDFIDAEPMIRDAVRVYVTSFCERGNQLSQWRAYGGSTSGYSLAFDAVRLKRRAHRFGTEKGAQLRRVEYQPERQRQFVATAIERYLEAVRGENQGPSAPAKERVTQYLSTLVLMLTAIIPTLKAPVFEEEHEWRLVYLTIADEPAPELCFRAAANTIVPYVPLAVAYTTGTKKGLLPLTGITHAPSTEPELKKQSLLELLRANGYGNMASVAGSDIPLRVV